MPIPMMKLADIQKKVVDKISGTVTIHLSDGQILRMSATEIISLSEMVVEIVGEETISEEIKKIVKNTIQTTGR